MFQYKGISFISIKTSDSPVDEKLISKLLTHHQVLSTYDS